MKQRNEHNMKMIPRTTRKSATPERRKQCRATGAAAYSLVLLCILGITTHAADKPVRAGADLGLDWTFSQIVQSTNPRPNQPSDTAWLNGFWMQSIKSTFTLRAFLGDNIRLLLSCYGILGFGLPSDNRLDNVQSKYGGGGIEEAYASYCFSGVDDTLSPALTIGYFPFEYTLDGQRLGGYLFRTGVYPGYITPTHTENRIQGIQFSVRLPAMLRHDIFATVEGSIPANDISVTYLGRLQMHGFELDAGVMFHRLLRTDQGYYEYYQRYRSWKIEEPDLRTGDLMYYTKAGIKLLGRMAFDIKSLLKPARMLGPNDLMIYTEAAALGLVDIGGFYDDITERVPVMGGITLPTFGLVKVLGLEVEWYGSRWKNQQQEYPVPVEKFTTDDYGRFAWVEDPLNEDGGPQARADDWKWAVFVERNFGEDLEFALHVASDHFSGNGSTELLHAPSDWYWQLRVRTWF